MDKINLSRAKKHLKEFDFASLFIEELGWRSVSTKQETIQVGEQTYTYQTIAELGVAVIEVQGIPDQPKERQALYKALPHAEKLLIFVDKPTWQSVWYWVKVVKKEDTKQVKQYPRTHYYAKWQDPQLHLTKISGLFIAMSELDPAGNIPITTVAEKVKKALDVKQVTKDFFNEFQILHEMFVGHIQGITNEKDKRWYASVVLNRLMFIYFLQRKGFIDGGETDYLRHKLEQRPGWQTDQYYTHFLNVLFFEGFAKPANQRTLRQLAFEPTIQTAHQLLGTVCYLNGGLFLEHPLETKYPHIFIPDSAFANLFQLLDSYTWHLDDRPGKDPKEINPDVLGYIFEKYINQKALGAYYTRPEITNYLCEQTIYQLIVDKMREVESQSLGMLPPLSYDNAQELLLKIDGERALILLKDVLPDLSLLDPACGSGAFLVAAMQTLANVYQLLLGRAGFLSHPTLQQYVDSELKGHPNPRYYIHKKIITENLYGVDVMAEAVEIARLRLFLALVASVDKVEHLEPLPNIDFNILPGNSLIGLLRVDEEAFNRYTPVTDTAGLEQKQLIASYKQGNLLARIHQNSYRQTVAEKNQLVKIYKTASSPRDNLQQLRDDILAHREKAQQVLNRILLDEFQGLKIFFEQATWDEQKNEEGETIKRPLTLNDMVDLNPFHWGYEFDEVMNGRGGFDAIITNPPWEVFQTDEKEFFRDFSDIITKKKMSILEFIKEKEVLLLDPEIKAAWLEYSSKFNHSTNYMKKALQYKNQTTILEGKKIPSKINFFKVFLEQSYNLLHKHGCSGLIIPTSFYIDKDKTQLRKLLFYKTEIRNLFGLSNERYIFEGVDHRFRFAILCFKKGFLTTTFPVAFRNHPSEALYPEALSDFFEANEKHEEISLEIIEKLSPQNLSINEFKTIEDVQIPFKLAMFPELKAKSEFWYIAFTTEFDKTANKYLFETKPTQLNTPLYSGSCIHFFTHTFAAPVYYINEYKGQLKLSGTSGNVNGSFAYKNYRLVHRRVSSQTNERTLICTIIPPNNFCDNSLNYSLPNLCKPIELMFANAILSSFIADYWIRQKINNNITIDLIHQFPMPRLTEKDPAFAPLVRRAAQLICTTPEFDDLARGVGLQDHTQGVTNPVQRAKLRAEIDGLVAHVYGLTEKEFVHILGTFPLVAEEVKQAALQEYRRLAPNPEYMALIQGGENKGVEFKVQLGDKKKVVRAIASFLNSYEGGTLFIGVNDQGEIAGVNGEYVGAITNWDDFALQLTGAIDDKLKTSLPNPHLYYELERLQLRGVDVALVRVKPAPQPVFVESNFYTRKAVGSQLLNGPELASYLLERFKNQG